MTRHAHQLAFAALAAAALVLLPHASTSTAVAAEPARPPATVDTAAVDRFISEQLAATRIPGAAVAITRGDQVVHVRGFGHDAEGSPVTPDTPFRIASLSKSFTALAVMQLVDRGRLSLDDRVAALVSEFHPDDPRAAAITVRQLLNQTSGLADRAFNELAGPQPADLAHAIARLDGTHLVADPGTEWNYHNPNYEIAARVVEVVSGESFADYLDAHVFAPAGMSATTSTDTDNGHVEGLTDGHVAAYGLQIPVSLPSSFGAGAGGVVSTAGDVAKWLIVHANNGRSASGIRVVSTESVVQMHTPSTDVGYGLGWMVHTSASAPTLIDHSGNLLTFSAFQALLPDSGYGVALLFNSGSALTSDQAAIYDGVLDIVTGADLTPDGPHRSAASLDAGLGALTLAIALAGVRGVTASQRWASARKRRSAFARTWTALRLLPYVGTVFAVAAFPLLAGYVFGRAVTWTAAAYAWPALVILVLIALVAALATLAARIGQLRPGHRTPTMSPSERLRRTRANQPSTFA